MNDRLQPGTPVEVRNGFGSDWTKGFEVHAVADASYELRRLSDGETLPVAFRHDEVRPTRA